MELATFCELVDYIWNNVFGSVVDIDQVRHILRGYECEGLINELKLQYEKCALVNKLPIERIREFATLLGRDTNCNLRVIKFDMVQILNKQQIINLSI